MKTIKLYVFAIVTTSIIMGAVNAFALDIKPYTKASKAVLLVDGKEVTDAEAFQAAMQGKTVIKRVDTIMEVSMNKAGTGVSLKAKK